MNKSLILCFYLLFSTFTLNLYNSRAQDNSNVDLKFTGLDAYDYVEDQLKIGYRIPGTEASRKCANYFKERFKVLDQDFVILDHNFTVHSTQCQNVLFKLNPDKNNIFIFGAHYDSRARATKDTALPNSPVPGANDGASGCAVMIELAQYLYQRRENLDCEIWFLFIDAEDQGKDLSYGMDDWDWVEGSTQFVNDIKNFYDSNEEEFDGMILLDMVGGTGLRFIKESYSDQDLLDELFQIGRNLGFTEQFPSNPIRYGVTDDHIPFKNYGIPSADLIINFWSNPSWSYHHTVEDDITNIEKESLMVTGRTIEKFIYNNYYQETETDFDSDDNQNSNTNNEINYPIWDYVIFIVVLIMIISLTIISLYLIRHNAIKKAEENDNNKQL